MAKVVLKDVRLAFAQIWEAKQFEAGKGAARFNASFLFPPEHPAAKILQDTITSIAKEKWLDKADAIIAAAKPVPNRFCFKNGNTKPEYEGFPGNLFVSASNEQRPDIRDRDGKTPLTAAEGRPYSGCYVNAILDVWPQDNKYGKGIQAKLLGIQFVRDGDRFSGGVPAADDDFADLSDGAGAPDLGASSPAASAAGGFV